MSIFDLENYRALQDPSSAFSKSVTEDIDGTILERLEYIANRVGGSRFRVGGSGYQVYPSAAAGVSPSNAGVAWANGTWSQVVASTAANIFIVGVSFGAEASSFEAEIDIGVGAAGAEVSKVTIPHTQRAVSSAGFTVSQVVMLPDPIAVASGTRIAARVRSSSTSNEPELIKVIYVNQSDMTTT